MIGEWYLNRPHGICWVEFKETYQDPKKAIGTFTHGILHGGPGILLDVSSGRIASCSYIKNGKIYGQGRIYNDEGREKPVKSTE